MFKNERESERPRHQYRAVAPKLPGDTSICGEPAICFRVPAREGAALAPQGKFPPARFID